MSRIEKEPEDGGAFTSGTVFRPGIFRLPRRSFLGQLLSIPLALATARQCCARLGKLSAATCGLNPFPDELLPSMLHYAFGNDLEIAITEYTFVQPLLDQAAQSGWLPCDLFIVFFNPRVYATRDCAMVHRGADLEFLRKLRSAHRKPPLVIHNGYARYTEEQLHQAGAGKVIKMPFLTISFVEAAYACLDIYCTELPKHPLSWLRTRWHMAG